MPDAYISHDALQPRDVIKIPTVEIPPCGRLPTADIQPLYFMKVWKSVRMHPEAVREKSSSCVFHPFQLHLQFLFGLNHRCT